MGIRATFSMDTVRAQFDGFLEMVQKKQIERMMLLGEKCLTEARNNRGYMMQTGALLSSTGYAVFVDGVAVHTQFDAAAESSGEYGAVGVKTGQDLAKAVGEQTEGVSLVVVAGMNYASYVEAKGYNVLASAQQLAERELPVMLDKLIDNIKRAAE